MKKMILFLLLAIGGLCQAQTAKPDSVKIEQERQQKFFTEVGNNLKVSDFQVWYYDNTTAKKFDEFKQAYILFLQQQYQEWIKKQKK